MSRKSLNFKWEIFLAEQRKIQQPKKENKKEAKSSER